MGPVHSHAVAGVVQQDLMEGVNVGLFLRSRAAQRSPHPAQKLHDAEGLGDVIIGAAVQPAHGVQLAGFCSDHNDWQPTQGRGVAQLFQDGKAILTGEHHVKDHQLRFGGVHSLPEAFGRFKALHLVSAGLERVLLQLPDRCIILYDIDHLLGSSFSLATAGSPSGKR